VEILDVDVDGRGHPKVLTTGGPHGVAPLLAELRESQGLDPDPMRASSPPAR